MTQINYLDPIKIRVMPTQDIQHALSQYHATLVARTQMNWFQRLYDTFSNDHLSEQEHEVLTTELRERRRAQREAGIAN